MLNKPDRALPNMADDALSDIVRRLGLRSGIFTDAQYCGTWAVDTSGNKMATFHLIQDGNCWLLMQGTQPVQLNAGDFVFFPQDARHLLSPCEQVEADTIVNQANPLDPGQPVTRMLCGYFEFRSAAQWPVLDALPEVVVLHSGQPAEDTTRLIIDLILAECRQPGPGQVAALEQLSYLLFIQILRKALSDDHQSGLLAALQHDQIGLALDFIHRQPEHPWRLEELAHRVGMSRSAFASLFRQLVGQSAMHYLLSWRMQVAVDLLTTTNTAIAQIADTVGYASEAAFRNAFTKHVGQPPARLRRAHKPGSSSGQIDNG